MNNFLHRTNPPLLPLVIIGWQSTNVPIWYVAVLIRPNRVSLLKLFQRANSFIGLTIKSKTYLFRNGCDVLVYPIRKVRLLTKIQIHKAPWIYESWREEKTFRHLCTVLQHKIQILWVSIACLQYENNDRSVPYCYRSPLYEWKREPVTSTWNNIYIYIYSRS